MKAGLRRLVRYAPHHRWYYYPAMHRSEVLDRLGLPAGEIIAQAQSGPNKALLREQTELAARRGVFGAPTFFGGEEMFWGNNRLEEALECKVASGPDWSSGQIRFAPAQDDVEGNGYP